MFKRSEELFEEAASVLVGGVNSPVRAFSGVGGTPLFMSRGSGSHIEDEDGNTYIDYVMSYGPLILGHAHPAVTEAAVSALKNGSSFGAPTVQETELARLVQRFYPSMEKMRFVNSGTEACMGAIRAARGYTGRDKVVKFEGCYHGGADYLLVKAGSGAATLGQPDSAGVPDSFAENTIVIPYNDINALEHVFAEHGSEIAAVIVEPVAGNVGLLLPEPGFLDALRNLTTHYDSVLVFDEVLVGFRIKGGAQGYYNVKPDLTCLGKVIGGGFPVGLYGGKSEIMAAIAPEGPVYQSGTLSGNPVAMAAGQSVLEELKKPDTEDELFARTEALVKGFRQKIEEQEAPLSVNSVGSMFTVFFRDQPPKNAVEAKEADLDRFKKFYHFMLKHGIYLAPSAFETGFMSTAHSYDDIEKTLEVFQTALSQSV
ncbi:MAG: glutamate-1-semialdehyde 2,1-aminomutase [bacterium]